jgi:hypothetical protein
METVNIDGQAKIRSFSRAFAPREQTYGLPVGYWADWYALGRVFSFLTHERNGDVVGAEAIDLGKKKWDHVKVCELVSKPSTSRNHR